MPSEKVTCGLKFTENNKAWYSSLLHFVEELTEAAYTIDAEEGTIYVTGMAHPKSLLKRISKTGKGIQVCWVKTGKHTIHNTNDNTTTSIYDYYGYGYGYNGYGYNSYGYYDPNVAAAPWSYQQMLPQYPYPNNPNPPIAYDYFPALNYH